MAHFLLLGSSLLISAINFLLTQSGCSQITVMIETKSVAGADERAHDSSVNAVQEVDTIN